MSEVHKPAYYCHELNDYYKNITDREYPDFTRPIVEDCVQAPGPGEKGMAIMMGHRAYSTVQGGGVQWVPGDIPSFDTLDDAYEKPLEAGPIALTNPGFTTEQFEIAGILDLRMHGFPVEKFGRNAVSLAALSVDRLLGELREDYEHSRSIWTNDSRRLGTRQVRNAVTAMQQNLLGDEYQDYIEECRQQALRQAEEVARLEK